MCKNYGPNGYFFEWHDLFIVIFEQYQEAEQKVKKTEFRKVEKP